MSTLSKKKCTACGLWGLEPGFLPDVGAAQTWIAVWVPGQPSSAKSVWERMRSGGGVNLDGVGAKAVEAYRCPECGHLQLYATRSPGEGESLAR